MLPSLLLLTLLQLGLSYKFLAYNPQLGSSHVNFIARISDILIDHGHEVVMLSPVYDSLIGGPGTKKARVIELPQTELSKRLGWTLQGDESRTIWELHGGIEIFKFFDQMKTNWMNMCEETLQYPGLIEALKREKFDAAYAESMDICSVGLFHLIGIKKFVFTESLAIVDGHFAVSQTPNFPSYIPSKMHGGNGDAMNIWQRMENVFGAFAWQTVVDRDVARSQLMYEKNWPGFPRIRDLLASASLVFYNSEPLVDYPKITSARIVDIGGISVASGHKPINKTWSSILNLRPKTILIAFGTVAQSYLMPDAYKKSIRETARRFPDVTFVWKYEVPEHNISKGISNIVESAWIPQHDILHDKRLTAFITHGGQGSTTEAYTAGIPLIVIPVYADQMRNAKQIGKNGVGIPIMKEDLATPGPLAKAVREILNNNSYRIRASEVKHMIKDRPFSMKEIFIRNMEFVAKHGPLRQLDHQGRNLTFVQYYLIDMIIIVVITLFLAVSFVVLLTHYLLRRLVSLVSLKFKLE